ncbi:MAG: amidohydrolase family protein [Gemmatimonadaceae bacterium]
MFSLTSSVLARVALAALACGTTASTTLAQTSVQHGKRYPRMVIREAMVIDGMGTPASGPYDIVIENNRITQMVPIADAVANIIGTGGSRPQGDIQIDATGKYVLPGLINAHAHVQDERGGVAQEQEYEFKIWLASGITSVRDVGSDSRKTIALRDQINAGTMMGPRLFHYPFFAGPAPTNTPAEARARVQALKRMGVDGIKIAGTKRDVMEAMLDEAHKQGLRVAHHAAVEETNAWDDIRYGTTTIEHWYGIPDAAIPDGVQNFPADFNYTDEVHRFRYAGRLWREADPAKLKEVLAAMVKADVAWVPTLDIYEASRDLQRAQTQPWFKDYLHPTLEDFFKPNPMNHGSYFIGWTSVDEAYWKENYQIWFRALRDFARLGGTIAAGDDAGFIYQLYGFGMVRELELHQEAGFPALKVIQHATSNGAKVLGKENEIGRVRVGWLADLIVVNGNPLENLKMLYPTGTEAVRDGKIVHTGGVEWTIRDGFAYNGPQLMREVKELVARARARKGATS